MSPGASSGARIDVAIGPSALRRPILEGPRNTENSRILGWGSPILDPGGFRGLPEASDGASPSVQSEFGPPPPISMEALAPAWPIS